MTKHDEWLADRKTLVGASETPSILGRGYKTPAQVWALKLGLETEEDDRRTLAVGTLIQPSLINIARVIFGLDAVAEPDNVVRRSTEIEYVGASLDGTAGKDENGNDVPLEVKNVDGFNSREWDDSPPIAFQIQSQQQLFVTGASFGYVMGLVGGNKPVLHRVERNEAFIRAMLKKLEWFWNLVQTRTPPPYQDPYDQARVLAALYPKDVGTAIQLDEVAANIVARRDAFDIAMDEAATRRAECDNELRAMLGENTYGSLPDGRWVSWKQQTRKEHIVKASTFRVLRMHDKRPKDAPALTFDEPMPELIECDNEPAPFCVFHENAMEAEAAVLSAGAFVRHVSPSGSCYLVLPGGLHIRISDHPANEKTAAWMDKHHAVEIRVDEPDWRDRLASITGVLSAAPQGTPLCLPQ